MALDTENMNIYKVETDNDIYNVVRNYDINKLFDRLIVPNATKEQLKDNLKKALNEKNNDEALRILNYLLKYKHNYYKRNDILLDDESPNSQEKTITLKDAGYYEIIMEAASAKSPWFNKDGENFEHFLVKGSPWTEVDNNGNITNEYLERFQYNSPALKKAVKRAATKLSNDLAENGFKINPWYCEQEIFEALKYFAKNIGRK